MVTKWMRECRQRWSSTDISRMVRQPAATYPKACQTTASSFCWGYSHQSGSRLLSPHRPVQHDIESIMTQYLTCSQSRVKTLRTFSFAISLNFSDYLEIKAYMPILLDTKLLWQWRYWKSRSASKRDPWPWHSSKCSLCRFETIYRSYIQEVVHIKCGISVHGRHLYLLEPALRPPKRFKYLTRAEEAVITRLRIGHTKITKSHISARGPPTTCHHCGQTLTVDNMLLECTVS